MKKLKEKGITLVALVVTIIILLILAGVALRLALSENGLIKMAMQSGETARDASEEEKVKLAVSAAFLDGTGTLTKANVQKALENEFGTLEEGQLEGGDAGPWTFKGDRKTYTIGNGGDIQELKPKTVADLKAGDWVTYESSQGSIPCRVLYDTEYNTTNKTNYGIQIISEDTYGEVTFGSNDRNAMLETIESLRGAFDDLKQEDETYKKSNDQFILNVRCIGSDPSFTYHDVNVGSHSAGDMCYLKSTWPEKMNDNKFDNFIDSDSLWKNDFRQMDKLGLLKPGNEKTYWLSSFTEATSPKDEGWVILGYVASYIWDEDILGTWGSNDAYGIWVEEGDELNMLMRVGCDHEWTHEITNGIRPVFQLKSDIVLSEGDGQTKDTAYVLSKE